VVLECKNLVHVQDLARKKDRLPLSGTVPADKELRVYFVVPENLRFNAIQSDAKTEGHQQQKEAEEQAASGQAGHRQASGPPVLRPGKIASAGVLKTLSTVPFWKKPELCWNNV